MRPLLLSALERQTLASLLQFAQDTLMNEAANLLTRNPRATQGADYLRAIASKATDLREKL